MLCLKQAFKKPISENAVTILKSRPFLGNYFARVLYGNIVLFQADYLTSFLLENN